MCGDLASEVSRSSKGTVKPGADENLEALLMPPESSRENQTSQTDAQVQGHFLRENEKRHSQISLNNKKLTKLCSNAGLAKTIEKGQFFMWLDDDQLDRLNASCREYILLRCDQSSQAKGWIRGNTKIGPVLDVTVWYHQGRYNI